MDKRIARSEEALKRALVSLAEKKDPSRITVKELCQVAQVNRSTFYERYGYRNALVDAVLLDCLNDVCHPLRDNATFGDMADSVPHQDIRNYIDRFLENETLMRFCTCRDGELYRSMIVQHQIRISMQQYYRRVDYYPAYFQNAGVLNLLIEWVRSGKPVPEEEIVEIIHQFSKAMYHPYS